MKQLKSTALLITVLATVLFTRCKKSDDQHQEEEIIQRPIPEIGVLVAEGSGPSGVYVDASKNVYVSEYLGHRVVKYTPSGSSVVVAGGNGQGSALNQLKGPEGIFVDASGNVYVADYVNNRVVKW